MKQPCPKIDVKRKLPCWKWFMHLLKYQLIRLKDGGVFFPFWRHLYSTGRIIYELIIINQIDTTSLYGFGSWRQRWHNRQVGFLHMSTYAHFEGYFIVLPLVWMVRDPLILFCPEHPVIALMSGLWLLNLDKFLHSLERAVGCVGRAHAVWVGNCTFRWKQHEWFFPSSHSTPSAPV